MRPREELPHELSPTDFVPPPERKGWFGRNWMWLVPVGCLVPVVVCAGLIGASVFFGFRAIRQTEPFKHSLEVAQSNDEVVAALGEPITAGNLISAQFNASGGGARLNLSIPLSGPKGNGQLTVVADQAQGTNQWTYSVMQATVPGRETPIDLLPDEPAADPGPAEAPPSEPVQTEF